MEESPPALQVVIAVVKPPRQKVASRPAASSEWCSWRWFVTVPTKDRCVLCDAPGAVSACCTCHMCCCMSEGAFDPTSHHLPCRCGYRDSSSQPGCCGQATRQKVASRPAASSEWCSWRWFVTVPTKDRCVLCGAPGAVSACCTCHMCCCMSEGAFDPTSHLGCSDAGPKVAEGTTPSLAVYHLKTVIGFLHHIAKTVINF